MKLWGRFADLEEGTTVRQERDCLAGGDNVTIRFIKGAYDNRNH